MNSQKVFVRKMLKRVTATRLPGRRTLVELMKPLIVEDQPVRTRAYGGLSFELDLNDLIQRRIFFGLQDNVELKFLTRLVVRGDVVFDMGGNVGLYTVVLARAVGEQGRVYVFEPVPRNVASIKRNVSLNRMQERVTVTQVAVSDRRGEMDLYFSSVLDRSNSGWASLVPDTGRPDRVVVPTIDIDSFIREHGISKVDLIKMDIEGAELSALKGMRNLLSAESAPIIHFEVNPYLLARANTRAEEVKQFLAQAGYKLFTHEGAKLTPVAPDTPEPHQRDLLAAKGGKLHLLGLP